MNDKVFSLVRQIKPDIVLLHGTWEKHLDNVAETVVALKKETQCARRGSRRGAGVAARASVRGAAGISCSIAR